MLHGSRDTGLQVEDTLPQREWIKLSSSKLPSNNRFDESAITGARQSETHTEIQLEPFDQRQIDRRHNEVLLILDAWEMLNRAHIAIVFDGEREPALKFEFDLSRRGKSHPLMSSGTVEWLLEGKVANQRKSATSHFHNRAKFKRKRIFLGRAPHVIQFDIAAETDRPVVGCRHPEVYLGAAARILVIAIIELGGGKILADFDMVSQTVSGLDRLVNLVRTNLLVSFSSGRSGYAI